MAQPAIKVTGLAELRRSFRRAGSKALDKYLRVANAEVAKDINDLAQPALRSVSNTVASSATVARSAVAARIRLTSERAGGVVFGSRHGLMRTGPSGRHYLGYNQFRLGSGGPYHFYPEADTVAETTAVEHYVDALHKFLDSEGVPRG